MVGKGNGGANVAAKAGGGKGAGRGGRKGPRGPRPAPQATPGLARPRRARASRARPPVHTVIPNYLNPMCPHPVPTVTSQGRALPHTGIASMTFTVDTISTTMLICAANASSGTVGVIFRIGADGSPISNSEEKLNVPTMSLSANSGGPTSACAKKLGVTVINATNAMTRGGTITYINSAQRLPARGPAAVGEYNDILTGIRDSPYRRVVTADEMMGPHQLIAFPTDDVHYNSFEPFYGTSYFTQFWATVATTGPQDPLPSPRAMSTIVYIFPPTNSAQTYHVTVRAGWYTRWPLSSVPGQSMRNVPTASAAEINAVRDHAEETAHDLVHITEGTMLGLAAPRAAAMARATGGGVLGAIRGAVTGGLGRAATLLEGAAADIVGPELVEMAIPLIAGAAAL